MSFSGIMGQDRALNIIKGILRTGKIASAYLFRGEKGIGKFKTALEFAKSLNCESVSDYDACDGCISCRKIDGFLHPDMKVVLPQNSLIAIEQIRDIEEFVSLTPYEGKKKVVIVDDAEMMNVYSANAFLKTLEEPPESSVIVLVSSRQEMLSDTIRSRCLAIRFTPLSDGEMKAAREKTGLHDISDVHMRLAMGKVGLLFQDEVIEKRDIAFRMFEGMVRETDLPVTKDREELAELLDYFLLFLRDMSVYKCTGRGEHVLNYDLCERIASLCKEEDLNGIIDYYNLLTDVKKRSAYHLNKTVVFNYLSALLSTVGRTSIVKSERKHT